MKVKDLYLCCDNIEVDDVVEIIFKDDDTLMYVCLGAATYDILDETVNCFTVTDAGVTIKLSNSQRRTERKDAMLFKDLYSACSNLKSAMSVEVTKGTYEERLTVDECLEKYGADEVARFKMCGVTSQFLRVILKG